MQMCVWQVNIYIYNSHKSSETIVLSILQQGDIQVFFFTFYFVTIINNTVMDFSVDSFLSLFS